jgi:TPR repeat protein
MSSPISVLTLCAACGASSPLVCASCLKTRFCSPACAAAAWAGHRAACAEFSVLAELPEKAPAPVPPAASLTSMEPAAGAGAPEYSPAGTGFECAVCGKADAAVCARCRLVGYCGAEHQRKDWPTHKSVCRKGETRVVPVLSWEQRMLAEAHASAPASLAAMAALPPIPEWNLDRDGAPPIMIMRTWRKAADGGHAHAQYNLGGCYCIGIGVAKDAEAAAEWYAKAAALGHAVAQYNLGVLYEGGMGVAQNLKAAAAWYAKAAAQGHASAQFNLGVLYKNGSGVAQDFKTAAAWYAKAAAQGHANAQHNLGVFYKSGFGVAQDFKAAAELFAKAAAHGDANAQCNLGILYCNGTGVAQDFKAAAEWFTKAAVQGESSAQLNLGVLYENGTGVAQDFKAAAAWYAKAAASGHANAPAHRDACLARVAAAAAASRP